MQRYYEFFVRLTLMKLTPYLDIALNMPYAGGRRCVQVRLQEQHEQGR